MTAITVEALCQIDSVPPHDLRVMSSYLSANLFGAWQLAGVPSAAQRFNQLNAGEQLLRLKGNVCLLVGQQIYLRSKDIQIRIEATQISGGRQLNVALRRLYRRILLLKVLSENVKRGEIVFHLSEGSESGLAVVRHRCVVLGLILPDRGSSQARVKQGLGERGSNRPKPAWPGKPIGNVKTFQPAGCTQNDVREICRRAMPIWALALAIARSVAAISGRLSRSSAGTPVGMEGR